MNSLSTVKVLVQWRYALIALTGRLRSLLISSRLRFRYTYSIAASRVEQGLIEGFKHLNSESGKGALTVADFLALSSAVQYAQPFLCKRPTLGYAGAVLLEDDMSIGDWPSAAHLKKCDDCGYHRYMRD